MKLELVDYVTRDGRVGVRAEIDGGLYAPAEPVPQGTATAAAIVAQWAADPTRTHAERKSASDFLRQWPEGPQTSYSVRAAMGAKRTARKAQSSAANGRKHKAKAPAQ